MIYRPISGNLSADISNIGRFLLQTIWRTISPYRIGSRQKKRYRTISRPIFKTGVMTAGISSRGDGQGDVGSRAGEEKER